MPPHPTGRVSRPFRGARIAACNNYRAARELFLSRLSLCRYRCNRSSERRRRRESLARRRIEDVGRDVDCN